MHDRDDGLRQLPDPDEDLAEAERGLAVLLHRLVRRCEQLVQIHAGAKIRSRAAQRDHADLGVEIRALDGAEQGRDHRRVDRVLLLRAVERDREHAALHDEQHPLGLAHCATSISMRSNAVDSTFPWASVLSEMVPPPSSAPCSRKFNAMRFGSS